MIQFGETPVDPADLLERIERRLQQASGLSADRVFTSLLPDEDHLQVPPADRFVVLTPVRFPVWQSVVAGGGLGGAGFDATIRTTCFVRMNADQELRSSRAVRDATKGVLALTMRVFSALQFWVPEDSDGNALVREYPRAESIDFKPQRMKSGPWVSVGVPWQFRFTALLPST